ncbi:hypothetical protein [Nonomuraea roseoviolacea]|uniref:Uncharacterized protein n=1 Tax=Nonomuraea roseoviolacea subsp. carminata TaxID=160689 RepID=A0ABT1K902_9ACTN|nr:hypothetical protein [Nonomuraea roseoviolacea]MCP2350483.1 hypothetical protein [Nonomuraea roseoviolacea subsp. carminata]
MTDHTDEPQAQHGQATTEVGPWLVTYAWTDDASQGGPMELSIRPRPDADPAELARGITTSTLRAIPLANVIEARKKAQATNQQRHNFVLHAATREIRRMVEEDPRPGSRGRPDLFYVMVAFAYAIQALRSKSPVNALAQATGADRRTAENWIRLARERGMISAPTPGMPGGKWTPKAEQVLTEYMAQSKEDEGTN